MLADTAVHRSCPVCGRDNAGAVSNSHSRAPWLLKTCSGCGMTYLENAPAYEALAGDFAWEKTSEQEERRRREKHPVLKHVSHAYKRFRQTCLKRDKLAQLVHRHIPEGNVLDVGCASGGMLARLTRPGVVPFGIEVSHALAAQAARLVEPLGGRIFTAPALDGLRQLDANQFAGVLLSAYLEHEVQPGAVLQEIHRVLRPQGRVVIKVPNYASWNRAFRGLDWSGFRFPDHVNYFTPATLRSLVQHSGLRLVQFGWRDHPPTSDNMWLVAGK